jgi:hypothetical protein
MICKCSINPVTNPNLVYSHSYTWQHHYVGSEVLMMVTMKSHTASVFRSEIKSSKKSVEAEAGGKLSSAFHLHLLVSCLNHSLTLKMEVICSSEIWGCLWIIWCCNPEDHTFCCCHCVRMCKKFTVLLLTDVLASVRLSYSKQIQNLTLYNCEQLFQCKVNRLSSIGLEL